MATQDEANYRLIEKVIDHIRENNIMQTESDEVVRRLQLSPVQFQQLFSQWAGVSPGMFFKYISVGYTRQILKGRQPNLFDANILPSSSETEDLHDSLMTIEAMTPREYKSGGKNLSIDCEYIDTPFGKALAASTEKGICYLAFIDNEEVVLDDLTRSFPKAKFFRRFSMYIEAVQQFFKGEKEELTHLKLHLQGTPFQLKVWNTLLKIPAGSLTTYGKLAAQVDQPGASRAVGTAVGKNPVAFLIPCHRVIRSNGIVEGYRWGTTRKIAMIGWEAAKTKSAFRSA